MCTLVKILIDENLVEYLSTNDILALSNNCRDMVRLNKRHRKRLRPSEEL